MGKEIPLSSIEEQLDEAQDLVILADSVSSASFIGTAEVDPITQAIRQEILQKQRNILKEYIAYHLDATVTSYDDQEFAEYLKNVNNRPIIDQAFANTKVKDELEKIEIAGYKKVHHNLVNQFHTINWQDGDRQGNVRSQIVKNDSGDELAIIKETTHKINAPVSLSDGTLKKINNYRTIDFPIELPSKTGSMHLSLAVKNENGRNIALDRAVYFTAHYDSQGKLSEISSPKPVRFNGEGDQAIGYIEHLGQVYSLPVTQGKYREMMLVVERNKGEEMDFSQIATVVQDKVVTTEVDLSARSDLQNTKRYHEEKKELAEEKLTQIAKHYRLEKEKAELITKGLQYDYNHNNAGNRQLFEQQAEYFKKVHELTPQQAIIKYQEILDILQPAIHAREQERKLLQQLAKQNPDLVSERVVQHYNIHAVEYQKEKKEYVTSKALEELESIIEMCGGYQKLGLTAIKEQSSKSDKSLQAHSKKAKEESKNDFVPNSAKTITGSMIKKFMCKDYKMPSKESEEKTGMTNYSSTNHNIIIPQTTPRVQLKETQVNKR